VFKGDSDGEKEAKICPRRRKRSRLFARAHFRHRAETASWENTPLSPTTGFAFERSQALLKQPCTLRERLMRNNGKAVTVQFETLALPLKGNKENEFCLS